MIITYPPALRRTGFVAPRAIGVMGAAVAEARAAAGRASERSVTPLRPLPADRQPPPAPAIPERRTVIRLWLPITLLFLLLAPFAILLSPLLWLVPRNLCPRPITGVFILGAMLLSLGGTSVDVETPDALVRIRLF